MARSWPSLAESLESEAYDASAVDFFDAAVAAIKYHRSPAEIDRRISTKQRRAIMEDAWGDQLIARLKGYYQPETLKALLGTVGDESRQQTDLASNPFRDIVNELAVLYLVPPIRAISVDGALVDGLSETYAELCGGDRFHLFWDAATVAAEAFQDVILWPAVRDTKAGRQIIPRWAAGDTFSVVVDPNDPLLVEALVMDQVSTDPDASLYSYWSDDWHGLFAWRKGDDEPRLVSPGYESPYTMMPFVHVHAARMPSRYFSPTVGDDLVAATMSVGEQRMQLRYSRKMSSFKQGVITGREITDLPSAQLRDEGSMLRIAGEDINFTSVDWQIDFGMRHDGIQFDTLAVGTSRGINPERLKRTANYQTAAGAQLADRGLKERRERTQVTWKLAEADFYRLAVMVGQTRLVPGWDALPASGRLTTEYRELAYPADPAAQLKVDADEVELGVKSLVDMVRERDPKLSEKDALRVLKSNLRVMDRIKPAPKQVPPSAMSPTEDPTTAPPADIGR